MSGSDRNLRIQVLLGAVDKLTRPLVAATRETRKMGVAVAAARKRIKELEGVQAEVRRLKQLEKSVVDLAAASKREEARAQELHRAFVTATAPTKKMAAELSRAGKASEAAAKAHHEESDRLNLLRTKLDGAGISSAHLAQHETRLAHELKAANEGLFVQRHRLEEVTAKERKLADAQKHREEARKRSEKIAGMGTKAIAAGAGLGAPFVLAAKAAMNFEAEMANVRKIVDFKPKELPAFQNRLLKIGTDLNLDGPEMAKIAAQGAMGGVTDQGELLKFSRDAALMKEAMNFGDAQQAGEMAAGWRHAFNIRQEQVHELGDVITGLTRKWGAKGGKGEEIGTILASVGTIAQVAGSGRKETAALAAVLSSMNIEAGVASTGIRNLMINLTRGAAATGPQRKAYKALGIDAQAMAEAMQKDAGGAIVGLLTKIKALPRATQAGVLTQLFGARSIGPIGSLLERLDRVQEALGFVGNSANYTGQMELEYSRKTDTTTASLAKAKAQAVALAITVGTDLLPLIRRGAEWFGRMAGRASAWAAAHPRLSHALTMSALALSGLLIVAGGAALIFAGLLGPLALMNVAFADGSKVMGVWKIATSGLGAAAGPAVKGLRAMTVAMWEADVAADANPLGLIVLAIVAIVAVVTVAVLAIQKFWGPLAAFFGGVGQGIAEALGPVAHLFGWMRPVCNALGGAIGGVIGWLVKLLEPVRSSRAELDGMRDAGRNLGKALGNAFLELLGRINPVLGALLELRKLWPGAGGPPLPAPPQAKALRAGAVAVVAAVHAGAGAAAARPISAAPRGGATVIHQTTTHHTTVYAAPGQDPKAVGRAVVDAHTAKERADSARRRSSFTDRGRDPEP